MRVSSSVAAVVAVILAIGLSAVAGVAGRLGFPSLGDCRPDCGDDRDHEGCRKFLADTVADRQRLEELATRLEEERKASTPDTVKIIGLSDEIIDLRSKIEKAAVRAGLWLAFPGPGRRGSGPCDGPCGDGPCDAPCKGPCGDGKDGRPTGAPCGEGRSGRPCEGPCGEGKDGKPCGGGRRCVPDTGGN